jgi:cobalamin biosynthesis protein CobC
LTKTTDAVGSPDSPQTPVSHGGALARAMARHGGQRGEWMDLSTGINPNPPMAPALDGRAWTELPDEDLTLSAIAAARLAYGVPDCAAMVAAPGVQAIIQLLPRLRPGASCAVLGPTYAEYVNVFQSLGRGAQEVESFGQLDEKPVVVVVNPNNPDGRRVPAEAIVTLARRKAAAGGMLVVDEAFCDLHPQLSVVAQTGMPGLLVLKSFGKFYGLAGIRLGFAVGHADDVTCLASHLGPWAVSGPALAVGASLLGDAELRGAIAARILANAEAQRAVLEDARLTLLADTGLFHLVSVDDAHQLHHSLAERHILTRAFDGNPHWLRFGLCAGALQRDRLARALKDCVHRP